jgi:DNA-binding transcriptional MerR regulator
MDRVNQINTAYPADRAASLAGVPTSTLHYWAREKVLVPSVSQERLKLWSFADLMALRTIAWLRRPKVDATGRDIAKTSMKSVRRALRDLRDLDLSLWREDGTSTVLVDRGGSIHFDYGETLVTPVGAASQQVVAGELLDLAAPFSDQGRQGPDLRRPRPQLRIVPGKLAGAPHVAETRLETEALFALAQRGVAAEQIARLYPFAAPQAIAQALELEAELHKAA